MMSGMKGFVYCCSYFPSMFVDKHYVSCLTLMLVTQGISYVMGSSLAPTGVSSLGCHDKLRLCNCAFFCQRVEISWAWCRCMSVTCACSRLTIKDKSIQSSTCTSFSLCCCSLGCVVAIVSIHVRVIAITLGAGNLLYSIPQLAPKCSCRIVARH